MAGEQADLSVVHFAPEAEAQVIFAHPLPVRTQPVLSLWQAVEAVEATSAPWGELVEIRSGVPDNNMLVLTVPGQVVELAGVARQALPVP
jgi:hypothetical protein